MCESFSATQTKESARDTSDKPEDESPASVRQNSETTICMRSFCSAQADYGVDLVQMTHAKSLSQADSSAWNSRILSVDLLFRKTKSNDTFLYFLTKYVVFVYADTACISVCNTCYISAKGNVCITMSLEFDCKQQ